ncbi:MAG: flagellar motor switch phosphatase FliY [bacterium]
MGENDMLSQDEINALLNGLGSDETESEAKPEESVDVTADAAESNESVESASGSGIDQNILDGMHKDTLGEIGNISMGSAATTLSMLLNQKVQITTPTVSITNLHEVKNEYPIPCLLVDVKYTQGLTGSNILMIDMKDAAIIADLMMGGDGSNYSEELSEIHLSAVSEAMNQMMGSTATSISGMFGKKIDISPPYVKSIDLSDEKFDFVSDLDENAPLAKVSFKMEIGTLINSNIMQLIPIEFAKEMVNNLLNGMNSNEAIPEIEDEIINEPAPAVSSAPPAPEPQPVQPNPTPVQPVQQPVMQQPVMMPPPVQPQQPVNVQPAQFAPLTAVQPQEIPVNMGLLMDVPLQATVELGRTKMPIKEILDLGVGSIIELDKLAGEPVDLVVNGKLIAKGEVVVIDENFGLRITDILSTSERVSTF